MATAIAGYLTMSLYDQFNDEADFRRRFVKPLLNKMGFFSVTETHGVREFGSDFLFSELNRFGIVCHYAAQVKHERTLRQGAVVETLLTQVRQAFAHPFRTPESPRPRHVAEVYILNSGMISDNGKDQLLDRLGKADYGDNVHFFDGDQLDQLNRWATFDRDREVRERLTGLRQQLDMNIHIWNSVRQLQSQQTRTSDVRGSILAAIEEFLTRPLMPNAISPLMVQALWEIARRIDAMNLRFYMGKIAKDIQDREQESIIQQTEAATRIAMELKRCTDIALLELRPLVAPRTTIDPLLFDITIFPGLSTG